MPNAKVQISDKGYESGEFRDALNAVKITTRIPARPNRTAPTKYFTTLYKQRHKVEYMFAEPKDWRHIATQI